MKFSQIVDQEWKTSFAEIAQEDFLRSLGEGRLTLDQYKGFLRETYHNTSFNPRLGSLFHAHVSEGKSSLMAKFLKHNASEVGHNELALDDLEALGVDIALIKAGRPLVETEALAAFTAFQIQFRNPLTYLGYLYHLEALALEAGEMAVASLSGLGIPAGAFTFLREHSEVDAAHLQFNRDYIDNLAEEKEDLEAILWGMRGVCRLYGNMLQAILENTAGGIRSASAEIPASVRGNP